LAAFRDFCCENLLCDFDAFPLPTDRKPVIGRACFFCALPPDRSGFTTECLASAVSLGHVFHASTRVIIFSITASGCRTRVRYPFEPASFFNKQPWSDLLRTRERRVYSSDVHRDLFAQLFVCRRFHCDQNTDFCPCRVPLRSCTLGPTCSPSMDCMRRTDMFLADFAMASGDDGGNRTCRPMSAAFSDQGRKRRLRRSGGSEPFSGRSAFFTQSRFSEFTFDSNTARRATLTATRPSAAGYDQISWPAFARPLRAQPIQRRLPCRRLFPVTLFWRSSFRHQLVAPVFAWMAVMPALWFSLNWDKLRGQASCTTVSIQVVGWCDRREAAPARSFRVAYDLASPGVPSWSRIPEVAFWTLRRSIRFLPKLLPTSTPPSIHGASSSGASSIAPELSTAAAPAERTYGSSAGHAARIAVTGGSRVASVRRCLGMI